jgi:hypothetical protein
MEVKTGQEVGGDLHAKVLMDAKKRDLSSVIHIPTP